MSKSQLERIAAQRAGEAGANDGLGSAFQQAVHHVYAQTDGTYAWPNSREGDMLREANREIERLRIDAARYRWLHDSGSNWISADVEAEARMNVPENHDWSTTIDATVDSLMRLGSAKGD